MGVKAFQDLCDGFCDAAGVARQLLQEDAEGVAAFSTEVQDVIVNVMHVRETHPHSAFILVDFGPPPLERTAEILQALLCTNFTMLGEKHASAFSIHPVFGNVTLQATYAFDTRTGVHLLQAVKALVALAVQWRTSFFLDPDPSAAAEGAWQTPVHAFA